VRNRFILENDVMSSTLSAGPIELRMVEDEGDASPEVGT
jgi:hypothetical protein